MRDLVGNPEDRFSHNEAHMMPTVDGENQVIFHECLCIIELRKKDLRKVPLFSDARNLCCNILYT